MNTLWLIFTVSLYITKSHLQEIKSVNSCYYCESKNHTNCADPFDTARVNSTPCVDFFLNEAAPKIDIRFREKRQIASLGLITGFRCVKMAITHRDNFLETLRMCAPITKTITSGCENLKIHIEDGFTIKTCTECDKDNCNISSTIHQSNLLRVILTTIIYFTKFFK